MVPIIHSVITNTLPARRSGGVDFRQTRSAARRARHVEWRRNRCGNHDRPLQRRTHKTPRVPHDPALFAVRESGARWLGQCRRRCARSARRSGGISSEFVFVFFAGPCRLASTAIASPPTPCLLALCRRPTWRRALGRKAAMRQTRAPYKVSAFWSRRPQRRGGPGRPRLRLPVSAFLSDPPAPLAPKRAFLLALFSV